MRDPYLYDDCDVLKNKLGIKSDEALNKAEVNYSCNAIHDLAKEPLSGSYDFEHYCKMHHCIFKDIYDWAGKPRTIPMEKAEAVLGYMSIEYAPPNKIEEQANAVLKRMNSREWKHMTISEQAKNIAQDMSELWKIHAFREGNTRTTVTFICQFAESRDMLMSRNLFEKNSAYVRNALVAASAIFADGDFRKPEFLIKIVEDSLNRGALEIKKQAPQAKKSDGLMSHKSINKAAKIIHNKQTKTDIPKKNRNNER